MMHGKRYAAVMLVSLMAVLVLAMAGCSKTADEEGVVATVNGKPILLSQLEARYDLNNLSWAGGMVPAVDALREDYGAVLTQLIVSELVNQALERAGVSVTDADVKNAEDVIRADYPEGQFEKTLVEEYIDIDVWRSQLRQQLAMQVLKADILRPRVKLTYQEAEAYYKEHVADFYLPPRVRFLHLSGAERETVDKARDMYATTPDPEAIMNTFDGISIREMRMRANMLPVSWKTAFDKLKEGQISPVLPADTGFEALVLLENMPEKVLGPSHAYPLVEKVLLEQKMQAAFESWLQKELGRADIKVTRLLLQHKDDEPAAARKKDSSGTK